MIDVQVYKTQASGITCSNLNCKKNPANIFNLLGKIYHIKKGAIVARVSLAGVSEVYCYDCIKDVFDLLKSKLDSKLWMFH